MEKHTSTKAHTSVLHITSVRLAEGGGGLTTWSPERILHVIRSEPNPLRRFGKPVMSGNQYKNHRLQTCLWAGRVYLCASYRECYVGDRQSAPEQIGLALM